MAEEGCFLEDLPCYTGDVLSTVDSTTDSGTYDGTLPADVEYSDSTAAGSLAATPLPSTSTTTSAGARDSGITPSPAATESDEENVEANADEPFGAGVAAALPPRTLLLAASVFVLCWR